MTSNSRLHLMQCHSFRQGGNTADKSKCVVQKGRLYVLTQHLSTYLCTRSILNYCSNTVIRIMYRSKLFQLLLYYTTDTCRMWSHVQLPYSDSILSQIIHSCGKSYVVRVTALKRYANIYYLLSWCSYRL